MGRLRALAHPPSPDRLTVHRPTGWLIRLARWLADSLTAPAACCTATGPAAWVAAAGRSWKLGPTSEGWLRRCVDFIRVLASRVNNVDEHLDPSLAPRPRLEQKQAKKLWPTRFEWTWGSSAAFRRIPRYPLFEIRRLRCRGLVGRVGVLGCGLWLRVVAERAMSWGEAVGWVGSCGGRSGPESTSGFIYNMY